MVKERTSGELSDAKPSSPGSLPGTAVKALTIRAMMGRVQMMPATKMTMVSCLGTFWRAVEAREPTVVAARAGEEQIFMDEEACIMYSISDFSST